MKSWVCLYIIGIFIQLLPSLYSQQINPQKKFLIDKLIEKEFLPLSHVPAVSLAIVQENGKIVYTNGYGSANIDKNIPANNNTLVAIGSISKSFTAVIVARTLNQLYPEQGEDVLDIPIAKLLPPGETFILNDRYRSELISFKDLMSHRACLEPTMFGNDVSAYANRSEYVYRHRYAGEACPFRSTNAYNNGYFLLAGEAIGRIANKTFESMMMELFNDLGMASSTLIHDSNDLQNMGNLAQPYYYRDAKFQKFSLELIKRYGISPGAGGILSTANDMAKYLEFHLCLGKIDGVEIIPKEVMNWIYKAAVPVPLGAAKSESNGKITGLTGYSLGLMLGLYDGWQLTHHYGYVAPYDSYMSLYPALKFGIFSSTSGPGTLPSTRDNINFLHPRIFDILMETNSWQNNSNMSTQMEQFYYHNVDHNYDLPLRKNKDNLKCLVGSYGEAGAGQIDISNPEESDEDDGDMYAKYGYWGTGYLRNTTTEGIYRLEIDSDFNHDTYATGEVVILFDCRPEDSIIMHYDGLKRRFERGLSLDNLPEVPWASRTCD